MTTEAKWIEAGELLTQCMELGLVAVITPTRDGQRACSISRAVGDGEDDLWQPIGESWNEHAAQSVIDACKAALHNDDS